MTQLEKIYQIFLASAGICTDTRKVKPGNIFWALKGPRFNGNTFAQNAIDQGAVAVVVDEPVTIANGLAFEVPDALKALQALANHHRKQFDIPILAITGSNGKTTTKELIYAVLNQKYRVFATQGNLNNHIGVPLSLLSMRPDTEIAVIEMGANHVGEIAELCLIAEPTHGLITNIGKAHLEGFGSIEGVKKGKGELFEFLQKGGGRAFVNYGNDTLKEMAGIVDRAISFSSFDGQGKSPIATYITEITQTRPSLWVRFTDGQEVFETQTQLYGKYNAENLAAAIAVGLYFKVDSARICNALEVYVANINRSEIRTWGTNTIILDAYNANPSSMEQAIKSFRSVPSSNKVLILGQMLELGSYSDVEHLRIAELATSIEGAQVMFVGAGFEKAAQLKNAVYFDRVGEAREWLDKQSFEETHFLIKGSRGVTLEKLFEK